MKKNTHHPIFIFAFCLAVLSTTINSANAHDPIFAIGPHTLFKGGVETALSINRSEKSTTQETLFDWNVSYGITGDWVAGIEIPYAIKKSNSVTENGFDDVKLFTKYRFWRNDSLGVQETAAALLKLDLDSANENVSNGAIDTIMGLTYGYESRKWYRWAAARYRMNGKNDAGINRGNKWLGDLVVGIRPWPVVDYYKPDTVVMLELNAEYTEKSETNGLSLTNTGGTELFISPGIFWTLRNFAIKSGVQIPIYDDLNGAQTASDYRANLTFEFHF